MDGKARTSRWRARQVADGGKPIGVTLTPGAAQALETLQSVFNWSQREAISLALELAAGHPELLHDSPDMQFVKKDRAASRLEDLEQRLEQLEALIAAGKAQNEEASPQEEEKKAKQKLIAFTAKQMIEHGERMSRVQLYALAKQHNMPVPPSQHEYNMFISYHMDRIREMMRSLKERTH